MSEFKNAFEELQWRGLVSQTSGNVQKTLADKSTFYIGLDPTADSLGVHHLVGLMASRVLQKYGLKPLILVGGATCAIGDPSGKSAERKSIDMETVFRNVEKVKSQIARIIDFSSKEDNGAVMVNNYDWLKDYTLLDFLRNVGKKITVNYLMAKENVRRRLERDGNGISFQEFSYGILQGYDFVHLYEKFNCKLQIGGTDNLGNIVTGIDLIHKMLGKDDASGLTWDLITCADGKKFGKTEGNAVWLDSEKTSPYEFYQFWINQSDVDSERFIKLFTLLSKDEIESVIEEHRQSPSKRVLQQKLASYMTELIHGKDALEKAISATQILFGKATKETLGSLDEATLLSVMRDVKKVEIPTSSLENINIVDLASSFANIGSKGEIRKLIKANGLSLNKEKITSVSLTVSKSDLLNGKYLLLQKGKRDYTLAVAK